MSSFNAPPPPPPMNAGPGPGMAQCSVTGKWVPEDEIVTLHGQRVCAEGKAILLERLRSGEAMPGELEKPTVLRRFGSIFLDNLILGIPTGIATVVIIGGRPDAFLPTAILTMISSIVYIVYFGAMHASSGQTVGKKAGKIRVVRDADGGAIAPNAAYVRAIAYAGPNFISGLSYLTQSEALIGIISIVVGLYALCDVIFALADRARQRSLHDRIAGTRVIDVQHG